MGLETAALVAVGGLGVAQYQQQGAAGKFNQSVQNRNAQLSEQEAAQMAKQLEFDLIRFDQNFKQLQGQTTTRIAKTGADFTGTGLKILRANVEESELQKNIMEYNSKVGQAKKIEEANFYRIQGQVARQQAKSAQISTLFSTGTSLLSMSGGFGKNPGSSGPQAGDRIYTDY
jgi:CheY-like chemotaxis protein